MVEDMKTITVSGVDLTADAYSSLESVCCTATARERMVVSDLADLREGRATPASFLAECLNGADEAHAAGWREYADAVIAAARVLP